MARILLPLIAVAVAWSPPPLPACHLSARSRIVPRARQFHGCAPNEGRSIQQRLSELEELLDLGLVTQDEYNSKRAQIEATVMMPPPPSVPVSPPPAASPPAPPAPLQLEVLRARLLTLIRRMPERGRLAVQADMPPFEIEAVLELVGALEAVDPSARDGWMSSDAWGLPDVADADSRSTSAPWVLRYTSSKLFHRNDGLSGYASRRPDVLTPELLLEVDVPRRGWLTFTEPIVRPGATAAADGDSALAECLWQAGGGDVLKIDPKTMRADGREWAPRDTMASDEVDMDSEKAIRVLAATRPVFLDDDLLLMRSAVLEETIFVWTRLGAADPPAVAIVAPEVDSSSLPASLVAALAAREKNSGGGARPRRSDVIPRYN